MNADTLHVEVHASAFPAQRLDDLRRALAARDLAGKWLYESPAQAQAWLDYHAAWSPSRTDPALAALYGRAAAAALEPAGGRRGLHLVSLGCGGGHKDAALLALPAAQRTGGARHYTPLDISPSLVLTAATLVSATHATIAQPGAAPPPGGPAGPPALRIHPLVADLGHWPALGPWLDAQDGGRVRRLVTCYGLLPNFEPAPLLAWLAGLLRPGDGLLLAANLSPGGHAADAERIVAQYDNPHALRWYTLLLEHVGLPREAARLRVTTAPLRDDGGAWCIEAHAVLRGALEPTLAGQTLHLAPGERWRLFYSNRFTAQALAAALDAAHLALRRHWLHADGEEGIFLCERAPGA
ncbi:MAG: L-histidine N(alpha)-methyltransferase [Candidatus Lambdaproteobacteria bacterium]|nr:L-histidine N(alpha)-methyltransferase [Candidatus Lambdaproteobacteria bacterium]